MIVIDYYTTIHRESQPKTQFMCYLDADDDCVPAAIQLDNEPVL